MKTCSRCGISKPFDQYNLDREKKDGLQTQCKECKRAAQKRDYSAKAEIYMDRQRRKRAESLQENRAHWAVYSAIKRGVMIRPKSCTKCGCRDQRIEAHHHKGYDEEFKLDVVFLCTQCHRAAELKESQV